MHELLPIVRTVCLLESRSEQYGGYLTRVLGPDDGAWVAQWAAEEASHGQRLRAWLATHDPDFAFDRAFAQLGTLPYHDEPDRDRPPAEELLSRCVVEALAAGFYRAMRDATSDPSLKALCHQLMRDEVRHYKGFLTRLRAYPSLSLAARARVIATRIRELDDDQIVFAAHCAYGTGAYDRGAQREEYLLRVYPLYTPEHMGFMQALLSNALGARAPRAWRPALRTALYRAVDLRCRALRIRSRSRSAAPLRTFLSLGRFSSGPRPA